MRVLVLSHDGAGDLGGLADPLDAAGFDRTVVDLSPEGGHKRSDVPDVTMDLIIALGGPWSVNDPALAPQVRCEVDLLQSAVMSGTPVLGICMGAQMLAVALGGGVRPGERALGWRWTESTDDELLASRDRFHVNSEWVHLPRETEVVARSAAGIQAFSYRSALGLQSHPEVTVSSARRWFQALGLDPADAEAQVVPRAAEAKADASALMSAVLRRSFG